MSHSIFTVQSMKQDNIPNRTQQSSNGTNMPRELGTNDPPFYTIVLHLTSAPVCISMGRGHFSCSACFVLHLDSFTTSCRHPCTKSTLILLKEKTCSRNFVLTVEACRRLVEQITVSNQTTQNSLVTVTCNASCVQSCHTGLWFWFRRIDSKLKALVLDLRTENGSCITDKCPWENKFTKRLVLCLAS